jgi:hypothetical protein
MKREFYGASDYKPNLELVHKYFPKNVNYRKRFFSHAKNDNKEFDQKLFDDLKQFCKDRKIVSSAASDLYHIIKEIILPNSVLEAYYKMRRIHLADKKSRKTTQDSGNYEIESTPSEVKFVDLAHKATAKEFNRYFLEIRAIQETKKEHYKAIGFLMIKAGLGPRVIEKMATKYDPTRWRYADDSDLGRITDNIRNWIERG